MRATDEQLIGRIVITADGKALGEVSGFAFNVRTWHIELLKVKLRKEAADEIGAPHGLFHSANLEIGVENVQSLGDAVVLSLNLEELARRVPEEDNEESSPS